MRPFDLVGKQLVAACVRNQTHYCDINGEVNFMREMIALHHDAAKAAGVSIVLCCGYDCVPSEVGNLMAHKIAAESGTGPLTSVHGYFHMTGNLTGGTMASAANAFEKMTAADYSATALTPAEAPKAMTGVTRGVSWNPLGGYSGPYVMASINERLVRRSNGLQGSAASYQESSEGTLWHALSGMFAVYTMSWLLPIAPIRSFLRRFVFPAPGTGPTDEELNSGRIKGTFIGENSAGATIKVEVSDKRHVYTFTGTSAAICGILLAEQRAAAEEQKGEHTTAVGGVITPAVAFGLELVDRLRAQGVVIKSLE